MACATRVLHRFAKWHSPSQVIQFSRGMHPAAGPSRCLDRNGRDLPASEVSVAIAALSANGVASCRCFRGWEASLERVCFHSNRANLPRLQHGVASPSCPEEEKEAEEEEEEEEEGEGEEGEGEGAGEGEGERAAATMSGLTTCRVLVQRGGLRSREQTAGASCR